MQTKTFIEETDGLLGKVLWHPLWLRGLKDPSSQLLLNALVEPLGDGVSDLVIVV